LTHISAGNLAAARPEGEEIVARFESDWLAHWVRGRVAAAEGNWGRAQSAFEQARELSPEAVLPVVWLIDLALRNGYDERAEQLLAELAELNPDHPLVPVGRAIVALGLDPLRSRAAGSLEVEMPEAETLSLRTIELVTYIRARQALAAWQMDQVAHVLRQLGEHTGLRPGVRTQLLAALVLARHYRLEETVEALDGALAATQSSSPAALEVRRLAGVILADLGRPDLALARIGEHPSLEVQRARMLVEAGREDEALRLLGRLLDQPSTRTEALRILVDFHLRRGPEVAERARLRASGLTEEADLAYAAARLAAEEGDWEAVREHAERALQLRPEDRESRFLWVRASAEMGFAERAIERIDEVAERSILVGAYELARLEVLLIGGAPRENIAEFVSLLQSTEPTSMTSLGILARAYESIGDIERARNAAQAVLEGEPNNHAMHALLGRLLHTTGQLDQAGEHLRTYLALAPASEPTDWAQTLLDEQPRATGP
jgi:tetratricopeptide (TPR) repeat protein